MPSTSGDSEVFEHYRVLRKPDGAIWELGRGAMGVTYKAIDDNLHMVVALKVINALRVDKESARERFLREARAAASLKHRNVATVHHLGQNAQNFFYAMEFIDGETVESLVKRAGPRPWREALEITVQVARALVAAHAKCLVHRDIKPANVMLVPEPGEETVVVKLIDFGLAKTLLEENGSIVNTNSSGFIGTPLFASPEQCQEEAPDIRSDIYSLGVTLWFLLSGRAPFNGPLLKVLNDHVKTPPPWEQLPAEVPGAVLAVVARMLAKERADRPQTPLDLRREMEGCLRGASPVDISVELTAASALAASPRLPAARIDVTEALAETLAPPPAETRAGSRWAWPVAALAMAAAVLAFAGYWLEKHKAAPPANAVAPSLPTPSVPGAPPPVAGPVAVPPASIAPTATPTPVPTPDGRLVQARAWIEASLRETRPMPDDYPKASALGDIAAAQARAGDLAGARQTADAIKDDFSKASALRAIAAAQARAGDLAGARQTADAIKDDFSKASALRAIAAAQARAGDLAGARQTFTAARQTADAINGDFFKASALRDIAAAQARASDLAGARQTADAIKSDSSKADALRAIAAAQARAGDLAGARQTFTAARQTADAINGDFFKASALRDIAAAQARASDLAGARQTADAIKSDSSKADALRAIAAAQARAGDLAGARQTFTAARQTADAINGDFSKASALSAIAAAQARAGDLAGARQTADAIKSDSSKADALRAIAAAQARAGDLAGARQTFTAARQTADAINGDFSKASALSAIAAAQARAGDPAGARQTADAIKDDSSKASALSAIAAAQARAGDFAAAEATIVSLTAGENRSKGYLAAANALLADPADPDDE